MPISDAKRLERRKRHLEGARALLRDAGYDNITLAGLAEACGVTSPTIYKTFGGKDEMLHEAVMESFAQVIADVEPGPGVRGVDRIIALQTAVADALVAQPNYARMLVEAVHLHLGDEPVGVTLLSESVDALSLAVEEMRADGELAEWVGTPFLVSRISMVQRGANTEWIVGVIPDDYLADMTVFTTCLLLLGITSGETAARCQEIARECQERIRASGMERGVSVFNR